MVFKVWSPENIHVFSYFHFILSKQCLGSDIKRRNLFSTWIWIHFRHVRTCYFWKSLRLREEKLKWDTKSMLRIGPFFCVINLAPYTAPSFIVPKMLWDTDSLVWIVGGMNWALVFLFALYILFLGEISLIKCYYFDNMSTHWERRWIYVLGCSVNSFANQLTPHFFQSAVCEMGSEDLLRIYIYKNIFTQIYIYIYILLLSNYKESLNTLD